MTDSPILQAYADKLRRLNVNIGRDGRRSPHKACMLLAMLDLARAGQLTVNRILYGPALLERYELYFQAVRGPHDHANPYFPFFHLKGKLRGGAESFWHLHADRGREAQLATMTTATSSTVILERISHASLDPALHELIQSPSACDHLAAVLVNTYFDRSVPDLHAVLQRSAAITSYERVLRSEPQVVIAAEPPPPSYVRSPAFRRVVIEAYDYRCAATGERIITPTGEALVEAAHIHPFSEAGDDDPRNGLALSRDMHWAMDRNLIAPGPDYKWHVSASLDRRIPDLRRLCELAGQKLILPKETRFTPKREALEWRRERLREGL